jgi:hypothetical protein
MKLKVIAFDADDTLFVNEPYFQETEHKFCALIRRLIIKIKKMYKKTLLFSFFFLNFNCFSQEQVSGFYHDLKNNRDFFQIVNDSTKQTLLFLSDKKKINTFLLNNQMEIVDSLSFNRPKRKYKDIIGYSGEQSNQNLFWATDLRNEIIAQHINLSKKKTDTTTYKINLYEESFLQCFSENKKFYILTVVQISNFLKLYVFDEKGKLEVKKIDLSPFPLLLSDKKKGKISDVFMQNIGVFQVFESSNSLQKIDSESPTSIVATAKKRKCYTNAKEIIISLDFAKSKTQLLLIDLKTFIPTFKEFEHKIIEGSENETINSNSLVFENKLIQLVLTASKMHITIRDLSNNLLKEYTASKGEPINFKNSDIVRSETSTFIAVGNNRSERVLEKTEQFLRKIVDSNVGISCYNNGVEVLTTIGSASSEIQTGGFSAPMGSAFGNGSPIFFSNVYFNSISDNFNTYNNRRVIYIDCLFDQNFNHVPGKIKPNSFDKIREFKTKNNNDSRDETVFKLDGAYYLGQYNNVYKLFTIRKFTD